EHRPGRQVMMSAPSATHRPAGGSADGRSDIEEDRFALAAQLDVEPELARSAACGWTGDQCLTPRWLRGGGPDRGSGGCFGLVRGVDPGPKPVQQAPGEYRDVQVRRLDAAAWTRQGPWADRDDAVLASGVGRAPAEPAEPSHRRARRAARVVRVVE